MIVSLSVFELWARHFAVFPGKTDPFNKNGRNPKNFSILADIENIPVQKKNYRIVITGGSVAYGWGASSDEQRFPAVLEKLLREKLHRADIDIINAGVPDFTASDELVLYLQKLNSLQPDMVIMFTGFNDFWDTLKYSLKSTNAPWLTQVFLHRVIAPSQTKQLFIAFLHSLGIQLDSFLGTFSRGYAWVRSYYQLISYEPIANLTAFNDAAESWRLKGFTDVIYAFHAVAESHHQKFLVVIQPVRFLSSLPQRDYPISHYERVLERLYRAYTEPVLRQETKLGIRIVDSNPALSDELQRHRDYLDFCHVNDEGNRLIAEYLERIILESNPFIS